MQAYSNPNEIVRDWYNNTMTYKERQQFRNYHKLGSAFDEIDCEECSGSGKCRACGGEGGFEHLCDCEYCEVLDEECVECNSSGKCTACGGSGAVKIEN
jgi:hypothetical protein